MNATHKALGAMVCLTILETVALIKEVDGALFVPIAMAIAALGGFAIGKIKTEE